MLPLWKGKRLLTSSKKKWLIIGIIARPIEFGPVNLTDKGGLEEAAHDN